MKLLSVADMARLLDISESLVYERAEKRGIGIRFGKRSWAFLEEDVEKMQPGRPGPPRKENR